MKQINTIIYPYAVQYLYCLIHLLRLYNAVPLLMIMFTTMDLYMQQLNVETKRFENVCTPNWTVTFASFSEHRVK
jgi:glutathione peroxidase-family protein